MEQAKQKKTVIGFSVPGAQQTEKNAEGSVFAPASGPVSRSTPIDIESRSSEIGVFGMSPLSKTNLHYGVSSSEQSYGNSVEKTRAVHQSVEKGMETLNIDPHARAKEQAQEKKPKTKEERRALQEKQRAEKKKGKEATPHASTGPEGKSQSNAPGAMFYDDPKRRNKIEKSNPIVRTATQKLLLLFSHLPQYEREVSYTASLKNQKEEIHPAFIRLGLQYSEKKIVGANSRCIAMLEAFKSVIASYKVPQDAILNRHLDAYLKPQINYLVQFRPMATSMGNAVRFLKCRIAEIPPEMTEKEAKRELLETIDMYIQNRIKLAGELIAQHGITKIHNGDVVLVYARSTSVFSILLKAKMEGRRFRVVVVDSRPLHEGKRLFKELNESGIDCTLVLINTLWYIMKDVTKVILGAHCVFSNGNVMSRVGTSLVAMMAQEFNVPVAVACETYKFSDRVQIDSFVYNEIADPDDLVNKNSERRETLADWRDISQLKLLNVMYDVTPSKNITVIITEIGMVPCSSVPVVLREYRPCLA